MKATLEITDADSGRVDIRVSLSQPVDPDNLNRPDLPASMKLVLEILMGLITDPEASMDTITLTSPEGESRDLYRKGGQG